MFGDALLIVGAHGGPLSPLFSVLCVISFSSLVLLRLFFALFYPLVITILIGRSIGMMFVLLCLSAGYRFPRWSSGMMFVLLRLSAGYRFPRWSIDMMFVLLRLS
jgi:hypothetical protein